MSNIGFGELLFLATGIVLFLTACRLPWLAKLARRAIEESRKGVNKASRLDETGGRSGTTLKATGTVPIPRRKR